MSLKFILNFFRKNRNLEADKRWKYMVILKYYLVCVGVWTCFFFLCCWYNKSSFFNFYKGYVDLLVIKYFIHDLRIFLLIFMHYDQDFNIFQVYQYFTIYRQYFLLKFEQFAWISYTTLFKIRRCQRPF